MRVTAFIRPWKGSHQRPQGGAYRHPRGEETEVPDFLYSPRLYRKTLTHTSPHFERRDSNHISLPRSQGNSKSQSQTPLASGLCTWKSSIFHYFTHLSDEEDWEAGRIVPVEVIFYINSQKICDKKKFSFGGMN